MYYVQKISKFKRFHHVNNLLPFVWRFFGFSANHLIKGLFATLPNERWTSNQCSSCSMRFGLFIKLEWFFTNLHYTLSVDDGLSVEGRIRWHRWDPTQLRTHRHVYNLPFQGCSHPPCHCTKLEKLCYRESQALHKERHDGTSPQRGDKLVQWVQRWNNKDNDWGPRRWRIINWCYIFVDSHWWADCRGGMTSLLEEDGKK